MKKIYIAPQTSVLKLQMENMIAASDLRIGVSDQTVDVDDAFSGEDDDWEEEDW